eukprot:10463612-Lingulodinium_polyedra.AAC.1
MASPCGTSTASVVDSGAPREPVEEQSRLTDYETPGAQFTQEHVDQELVEEHAEQEQEDLLDTREPGWTKKVFKELGADQAEWLRRCPPLFPQKDQKQERETYTKTRKDYS